VQQLPNLVPDDRREEVSRAIDPLLRDPDQFTQRAALEALTVWATAENVESLITVLRAGEIFSARSAIVALSKTDDQRAVNAIAAALPTNTREASQALKSMGAKAEEPTLPYLKWGDSSVRRAACDVLRVVGGAASLKELKKLAKDVHVRGDAEAAFYAIQSRVELAKREAEAEKKAAREAAKQSDPTGGSGKSATGPSGLPSALRRVDP
jgi:HEAT repeat protein